MPDMQSRLESWEVLDLLTSLVQKSLVVYEADEHGQGHYRLLETVRQYSRDRLWELGEPPLVRDRHLVFYLQWAESIEPELRRAQQVTWLDRMEREHENLRAALDWCQDEVGKVEAGLRLVGALSWFWIKRGYFDEGQQRVEAALARDLDLEGRVVPGNEAVHHPDSLERGVPASPDGGAPALDIAKARLKVLLIAWSLPYFRGDFVRAHSLIEEGLALARRVGDRWGMTFLTFASGMTACEVARDRERATAIAPECLALAQEVEDPWLRSHALFLSATIARDLEEEYARSAQLFTESLDLARETEDGWLIAMLLANLGLTLQIQGSCEQAGEPYREGLEIFQQLADSRGIAWCLHGLAAAEAARGWAAPAARLLGAADALLQAIDSRLPGSFHSVHEQTVAAARSVLTEEAFTAAWFEGRAMSLDQAVAYALGQADA